MRRGVAILSVLALAGCIPRASPPPTPPALPRPAPAQAGADRQCLAALDAAGIRYRPLPDRDYGNGCRTIGSVQLLEIGTPATNLTAMSCPLARAFAAWVREDVQPAADAAFGQPVRRVESMGTFACRPVNGQSGNRLSEHAFANAVDVGAFILADGRRVTVLDGWSSPDDRARQFLRAVHRAGCRRFNIGLGPDANAFHRDHLHFDMGRGPYCR